MSVGDDVAPIDHHQSLLYGVVRDQDADPGVLQIVHDPLQLDYLNAGRCPENGSSSSRNFGSMASDRAISTRRRSPPDSI